MKLCIDTCDRDNDFIDHWLIEAGIDTHTCCCCCPALEKCKSLNDNLICESAKNGIYNKDNCLSCDNCYDEY